MPESTITTTFTVNASHAIHTSAEHVWAVITELKDAKSMLPGVVAIEHLGGPAYGVGTRWRETREVFGQTASEVMEVTECVPLAKTTVVAESRGVTYTTEFRLVATDELTVLWMSLTGALANPSLGGRIAYALTAPIARRITKKAMSKDLSAIGKAAESRVA